MPRECRAPRPPSDAWKQVALACAMAVVQASVAVAQTGEGAAAPAAKAAEAPAATASPAAPRQANGCPVIRPPGLRADDVDTLVLGHIALALQQPAEQLDRGQSMAQLTPGPEAAMRYQYAARAIGEVLGFDAPTLFAQVARMAGREPPHAGLSLADLQAVARQAYAQGADESPPAVQPADEFSLGSLRLRPPQVAPGWTVLRCGQDQVVFWRKGAVDDEAASAMVRLIGLPAFVSPQGFADHLREVVVATVPAGHVLRRLEVTPVDGTPQPCAEAVLLARQENLSFRLRGRFCYAAPDARHGPAILFSHTGSDDVPQFNRESRQFIDAVR